jgi:hypothetical protein
MGFTDVVGEMRAALNDTFGVETLYAPLVGAPITVTGVFKNDYLRADAGEAGAQTTTPIVDYRLDDLPIDPDDDDPRITIAGIVYRVIEVQKDSRRGVRLLLHRTP